MIVFDTNLLVYAHRSRTSEHQAARAALEEGSRHPAGCGIALPCVAEFFAVVTHPAASGRPSTAREAQDFLFTFLGDARGAILHPGPDFANRLLATAEEANLAGPRIFDLQIALIARDHGADAIWTHDRGFVCVKGLDVNDPLS